MDCPFCQILSGDEREVRTLGTVAYFRSAYAVTEGHYLVIPTRHVETFFDMSPAETEDTRAALHVIRAELMREDASIDGFNIGMNCGTSAGQSIFHAHTHLIPRRTGDVENPRGGVRAVIPSRREYTETTP
ncbi:HIT family hydrolase [[Actinomadura] parvosata subsp. kistnae]|uniref:HIT family protein n=1 Tax=[Actinomadura] parvosata TaxID=1955412 RepID=UPI0009AE0E8B|nr:HIT family protein [Nonomuraea sp. ATCC 55076]SPL94302.1 HIT family hydrolase [Actinomadura parvosata subsp. kistnae]